jgi:Excalibur calcium-binding domain
MRFQHAAIAAILCVSACATAPKEFYANPSKAKDTALCRAYLDTQERQFKQDAATELSRRGLTLQDCQNKVAIETAAVIGIAAVATGVAVAAACQSGCSGPSMASSPTVIDYDCAGGYGDGPRFVQGPFMLSGADIYGLDRDKDGIACEVWDDRGA